MTRTDQLDWAQMSVTGRLTDQFPTTVGNNAAQDATALLERNKSNWAEQSGNELLNLSAFAPIGILQMDMSGSCIYSNRAWHRLSGLSQEKSAGEGWLSNIFPSDADRVVGGWRTAIQGGFDFETEYRICDAVGEIRYLHTKSHKLTSEGNDIGFVACVEDVTDRRRMQAERNEYVAILEKSLHEIYVCDLETKQLEFVNEGARKNLGYSLAELRKMSPFDINVEFDEASFAEKIKPLTTGEQELLVFETRHRRADGSIYPCEVRLQLAKKANRQVLLAMMVDITERIAQEKEHERINSLQTAILDGAAYALIATDPDGTITIFNPAAEELLGYSESELVGDKTTELFHIPDELKQRSREFGLELKTDLAPGIDVIHEKSRRGMRNEHEWTFVRKDGTRVPVLLCVTALRNDKGDVTGFLSIAKNIKEQKQAEAALRASEEAYRTLFDTVPAAVFVCDNNGTIQHFNRRAVDLWGEAPIRGIDNCDGTLGLYTSEGELLQANENPINQVLNSGSCIHRSELQFERADKSRIPVISNFAPLRDASGTVSGCIASFDDISDRKEIEEELKVSKERFELAIRGSADGLWDWHIETNEVYFSARFAELLGFDDAEFEPRIETLFDRIHPDDVAKNRESLEAHFERDEPYEVSCRMVTRSGKWRWYRLRGEVVRGADGLPKRMAGSMSDITHHKHSEEKLAAAAVTDQLTGLPNRARLLEALRDALTRTTSLGGHFACLFLDFDGFKSVNDSWGHDVGDDLLRQISQRLRQAADLFLRAGMFEESTIARLGGDEFVILLQGLRQPDAIKELADQLQAILAEPYELGQHQAFSTASVGVVVGPGNYERAEDVLRDADTAMYEAKHAGRARHVEFDEAMHTKVIRRTQLETDLRWAMDTDQLSLHYQPIVSLTTGEISAVEALIRWQHPTLGIISPGEFIPIAQESDLILKLGEWVLREGCNQCARWQATLGSAAPPIVSVNLARKQFADPGLPQIITRVLNDANLPPERLQLEVTEEAFALNTDDAVRIMTSITELGVRLAIDDFGSGTSSFVALHQFPVDVLKVDRSLITQIETSTGEAALLHGLVVMARNLNIRLIAEGIETSNQAKAVQELGCEFMQGYFFAKPMREDDLHNFLLQNRTFKWYTNGAMSFTGGWPDRMSYMVQPGAQQ